MTQEETQKKPPQNIKAERSLLGSLLIDEEAITKVAHYLTVDDFYHPKHKTIYRAILDLFQESSPIDILSLSNNLQEKEQLQKIGGRSYLAKLTNSVPTASNVESYAKIVQKKRILRDLLRASYQIENLAFKESENSQVLLDEAEQKIFKISQKSLHQSFTPLEKGLEETFERIDKLSKHEEGLRGVATGFHKIDNLLAGLQKSDLIILASRPSMGKSSLALNIARNVAVFEQEPVGVFSLEMSEDQIIDRLIASQADVDLWKLRTGRLSEKGEVNDFTKIQSALGTLSDAPLYIDDVHATNVLQMRAMARRLKSKHGLELLIIDYLQLMQPLDSNTSMVQQVTENSKALKSLAKELQVPVLVLSQLSRAVEKRTPHIPRLSDLRESGCLTGDTLITRADTGKRIPIKELVGQKDVLVHSLNENWQIEPKRISRVFPSGKKMTYELTLRSGKKIKASGNHPFRKVEGWTRLDQLEVGDAIATPRQMKIASADQQEKRVSWREFSKRMETKYCGSSLLKNGIGVQRMTKVANSLKSIQLLNMAKAEVIWDEIVSIKPLKVEQVYDATVPGTHNFVANDIIVHNSIEQDADVVMFIYREDFYKKDTPRENIGDIIVGKHRNGPIGRVKLYFDKSKTTFRNLEQEQS